MPKLFTFLSCVCVYRDIIILIIIISQKNVKWGRVQSESKSPNQIHLHYTAFVYMRVFELKEEKEKKWVCLKGAQNGIISFFTFFRLA